MSERLAPLATVSKFFSNIAFDLVLSRLEKMAGHKKGDKPNSDLGYGVKDIMKSKNGGKSVSPEDPYSSKQAFDVADDIRKRTESQEGSTAIALAIKKHHQDVVGEVPAHLESIPGVVVFDGARPRNEAELREVLKNNEELKGLVGDLQEKGKNVWAQANAHKGVVLTVIAVAAGVVGTGIYLHHKKEENKVGKASNLILKMKK